MDWNWQVNSMLRATDPEVDGWLRRVTGTGPGPLIDCADTPALLAVPRLPGLPAPVPPREPGLRAMWLHPQGSPLPRDLVVCVGAEGARDGDDASTLELASWLSRGGSVGWSDLLELDARGEPREPVWADEGRAVLVPWRLATMQRGSLFWASWPGPVVLCSGGPPVDVLQTRAMYMPVNSQPVRAAAGGAQSRWLSSWSWPFRSVRPHGPTRRGPSVRPRSPRRSSRPSTVPTGSRGPPAARPPRCPAIRFPTPKRTSGSRSRRGMRPPGTGLAHAPCPGFPSPRGCSEVPRGAA